MSYKPTDGMVTEAKRGLEWRSEHGRGGTDVGIARARDISNGKNLSEDTVKRMYSFFARHEVDKKAEGFRPGEKGYPSNGRIAWALWGGDAGFSWSEQIVKRINKEKERASEINESVKKNLSKQAKEHNEEVGDATSKRTSTRTLVAVFRRGVGAYHSNPSSVRPNVKSPEQWAYARVKSFRYALRNGKFRSGKHDTDLLPKGHPMSTERAYARHIAEIVEEDDAIVIKFGKSQDYGRGEEVEDDTEEELEVMEEEITEERLSKSEKFTRAQVMEDAEVDDRRVRMAISSEAAVERSFGDEVLDHRSESIDLEFLRSGSAPLLLDHDPTQQIGVVESVDLDGSARRLRATVRFSKNKLADEVYADVVDGIRKNVSIGYHVSKLERDERDQTVYRATSWRPMEVSIVSLPADPTVGVGRSIEASEEPIVETVQVKETVTMTEQTQVEVRDDSVTAYKEISEMLEIAAKHNQRAFADDCIRKGYNLAQFRGALLEKLESKPLDTVDVDMTRSEQQQYSLMRAIRSMASGKFDGFEREVSEELAKIHGKDARGFYVPGQIFARDILTSSPANGSNLVPTDHLADEFIDALRANLVVSGLGARMMQGLKGDVAIPALNAKTAAAFVAENGAPTEGAPTFRQVTMSPKTLAAYVDISRRLMMQSDPSVEQVLRADITAQFASKIDEVAINGGGANEPTGILQTSGIGSVAMGTNGGAVTYAKLVDLEEEVAIDNALTGSLSYLTNPKVVSNMRTISRQASGVEGNFILNDTNTLLGYNVASTTLVPSNLTKGTSSGVCSAAIFGNFNDLMIGMFGGLDILVDPYSGSTTGATRIAMYQDIDVAVRHAESFAAIQDITT